jgi:hypothetical protein
MTRKLHLSATLALPLDAVTQTFAFIGRRGAGKSFAAGKLVEEMLDVGAQVVVLDPVGNWYGLRTPGTGPGYPIPVLGGAQGDIPLEPTGGAIVADFIVDTGTSIVLDVSHFRKNQRRQFATDFAEQLFHRKKRAQSPLHIVIEESQFFIPQQMHSGDERLLGAVSDLALLGRNYGIGISLLSQRPQKVHKDVLNQTECLFAFQTVGPHERKAIDGWIAEKGIISGDASILAKLPQGTAIVWSPQWLEVYQKVKIGQKKTADTSATPTVGKQVKQQQLAPVDLTEISKAMASTIEAAKQNDPKQLRQQVIERDRKIQQLEVLLQQKTVEVERIEVSVLKAEDVERLKHVLQKYEDVTKKAAAKWQQLNDETKNAFVALASTIDAARAVVPKSKAVPQPLRNTQPPRAVQPPQTPRSKSTNGTSKLGRGPLRILEALAALHPKSLSRNQVSTLAGFSPRSSTFANYLSALRTGGHIEGRGSAFQLTELGLSAISTTSSSLTPPTTEELYALWAPRLPGSSKTILRTFIDAYPAGLTRDAVAEQVGQSTTSSTFANYLSKLKTTSLIEKRNGLYYASDSFFYGE